MITTKEHGSLTDATIVTGEPMAAVSKGNMLPLPIGCIFSIVLRAQIVRMLVYRGTEPNTSTLAVEL